MNSIFTIYNNIDRLAGGTGKHGIIDALKVVLCYIGAVIVFGVLGVVIAVAWSDTSDLQHVIDSQPCPVYNTAHNK